MQILQFSESKIVIISGNTPSIYSNSKAQALQVLQQSQRGSEHNRHDFYSFDLSGNASGTNNAVAAIAGIILNITIDNEGSGLSAATSVGDDTLDLKTNGYVYNVDSGAGNDNVYIRATGGVQYGSPSNGRAPTGVDNVDTGSGNDTLDIISKHAVGRIDSGSGNDTIDINGEGAVDRISSGSGNDTIRIRATGGRDFGSAITGVDVINSGSGNDTIDIISRESVDRIDSGSGNDTIDIVSNGSIDRIDSGSGNDTLNIASGGAVNGVSGGSGNDTINVATDKVVRSVSGGAGSDTIDINANHVSRVYAGAGNDTVNVQAVGVYDVNGGDGDDIITIKGEDVSTVNGNSGNDSIQVTSHRINGVRGGTGDDTMILDSQYGNKTLVYASEGDGQDYIEVNSELEIRFFDEGAINNVAPETVKFSQNSDGNYLIEYGTQGDSMTVKLTGAMEGKEIRFNQQDGHIAKLELVDKTDPLSGIDFLRIDPATGETMELEIATAEESKSMSEKLNRLLGRSS